VFAAGTDSNKKDLLHRLVKKVLIHDKRTIEVWYALPNQALVRTPSNLAPRGGRYSNRRAERACRSTLTRVPTATGISRSNYGPPAVLAILNPSQASVLLSR